MPARRSSTTRASPGVGRIPLGRLGGVGLDAQFFGDGGGEHVAAGLDRADELRSPRFVDDDRGEGGADGDDGLGRNRCGGGGIDPSSTSGAASAATGSAGWYRARTRAKGTRLTATARTPPAATAARSPSTVERWAATTRTRTIGGEPASAGGAGSRTAWSRTASSRGIGMWSAAEKRTAPAMSSSGIAGMSMTRTTTRAPVSPTRTSRERRPVWRHSSAMAAPTAAGSATSPSRTAPGGRGTSPTRVTIGPGRDAGNGHVGHRPGQRRPRRRGPQWSRRRGRAHARPW